MRALAVLEEFLHYVHSKSWDLLSMFKWNASTTNCKTAWQYNIVALNLTYVLWQKRGICNDKYTQEVTMNIQVKMLFAFKLLFDKGSLFFIPSPPPKSKNVAQHLHIQRVQKLTKNLHIIYHFIVDLALKLPSRSILIDLFLDLSHNCL